MAQVLFVSLISRDDKPLYIQSFDGEIDGTANASEDVNTANNLSEDNVIAPKSINSASEALNARTANRFLQYNFLSHMALDVFSSPVALSLREQQQSNGILLLFIQDNVTVYGMETNNGLKIVVGMGKDEPAMADVKSLFASIHKCYLKTICNPFSNLSDNNDSILQTPRFDKDIAKIAAGWNTK